MSNDMKNFAALCCLWLLTSCGLVELESSKNGKLDGYWHLELVDTLSTGGQLDLRQELRFWAIQGTIFELYSPELEWGQYFVSHFTHENGTLTLHKIYFDRREEGDPPVENVDLLRPFGINQLEGEHFFVEELTGSKMTLRNDALRLTFKNQ